MNKKKVLHIVSTSTLSGAEKVVSDICTNYSDEYEPYIVCAGGELKKYYELKGIETYSIDISTLNPLNLMKLNKLVSKLKVDLIHGHDVKPSVAAYIGSISNNVPVISHIHGTYPWLKTNSPLKYIDKIFRKRYAFNIACSKSAEEFYLAYNKDADKSKFNYLSNAFNFNEFNSSLSFNQQLRDELSIGKDDFVYGYCGRLIKLKGLDLLIESFNEISQKHENAKLLIVGDGEERNTLREVVNKYSLEDKVIFAGFQKNIYEYMNVIDCFVLSSIREGLPMVILEAIAMKKVIISTPVAGVGEVIKSREYGIILEQRKKENMIDAMKRVYMNYSSNKVMAEKAFDVLMNEYNITEYIKRLEAIYSNVIDRK